MLDLNPEFLSLTQKLLQKFAPNMVVWAYGSRVNGQSHAGSDLDLVIINPQNENTRQENLAALKEAFSESNLPILVDITDWAALPVASQNKIRMNHIIIQSAPTTP